ncbi:MAG: hypothetical protein GXP63_02060 [DPANN group archaeon]|nr:hypothetical protein [DPANN group archaeon]
MKLRNVLPLAGQILLAVITLMSVLGREAGLPRGLFWASVWILVISTFILIHRQPKPVKIGALIVLALTISLIHTAALPQPWQLGRDGYFETQYADLLAKGGIWDPTLGTGFAEDYYGHNPGVHMVMAGLSLTTGIDIFLLSKYVLFALFRLLLVGFAYLVIDALLGREREEVTFLATLIFIGSAGLAFVGVSRRTMGAFFALLALYALINYTKEPTRARWHILFGVFGTLLVISDHTSSYFFLSFLLGYWLYSLFVNTLLRRRMERRLPTPLFFLIFFTGILFVWEVYVSKVLIMTDISYIDKLMGIVASGFGLGSSAGVSAALPHSYYLWEIIMVYAAQVIFVLLGGIGFLTMLTLSLMKRRRGKKLDPTAVLFIYFAVFGFIMYLISSLFIVTGLTVAGNILLWFYGIPIAMLMAMFLRGNIRKLFSGKLYLPLVSIILVLLFTGSLFMGIYTPRVVNRIGDDGLVLGDDPRARTGELVSAGRWLRGFDGRRAKILGDTEVFEIFSGMYRFDVNNYPAWLVPLYTGDDQDLRDMVFRTHTFGTYEHVFTRSRLDYIVINDEYLRYPSELFKGKLENNTLGRYDRSPFFDRLYDNGQMTIYAIERS